MAITKIDASMYEDVSGANNLVKLDANAKIPAVSGANLTNLPGPVKSASDPTISSNKTVGTQWINTSSGEMYICTDATAGENVWTNVGEGAGDVQPVPPFSVQGSVEGYSAGGYSTTASPSEYITNIEKYSYSSDANASAAPFSLAQTRGQCSSFFSSTDGYVGTGKKLNSGTMLSDIEKYTFASSSAGSSVGTLTITRQECTGCTSGAAGYTMSGFQVPSGITHIQQIDKFVYASEGTTATDSGDSTVARISCAGTMSETHGYLTGGLTGNYPSQTVRNEIDRFAFASDGNMVDHGDLVEAHYNGYAVASTTYGYTMGGYNSGWKTKIQKFAFASASNATDIGDLDQARSKHAGTQSTSHGYMHGGRGADGVSWDTKRIEKWTFASDNDATDVGDLVNATRFGTGTNR